MDFPSSLARNLKKLIMNAFSDAVNERFSLTNTNLRERLKHVCCILKKKGKKITIRIVIACIGNEKYTAAIGGVQMFSQISKKPEVVVFITCSFIKWCRS